LLQENLQKNIYNAKIMAIWLILPEMYWISVEEFKGELIMYALLVTLTLCASDPADQLLVEALLAQQDAEKSPRIKDEKSAPIVAYQKYERYRNFLGERILKREISEHPDQKAEKLKVFEEFKKKKITFKKGGAYEPKIGLIGYPPPDIFLVEIIDNRKSIVSMLGKHYTLYGFDATKIAITDPVQFKPEQALLVGGTKSDLEGKENRTLTIHNLQEIIDGKSGKEFKRLLHSQRR